MSGAGPEIQRACINLQGRTPSDTPAAREIRGWLGGTDWRQRAGGLVFFSQLAMWALLNSEWVLFYQVNA